MGIHWHWGDIPTWFAAIGTVGALGFTIFQVGRERTRRLAQEAEDRESAKRDQARHITAWAGESDPDDPGPLAPWQGDETTPIHLVNGSGEPVYNVVVFLVLVQGAAPRHGEDWAFRHAQQEVVPWTNAVVLPPGAWKVWVAGSHWDAGMGLRAGAEVAFTDRNGAHWVRRGEGTLEELSEDPLTHYRHSGFVGPYDYQRPTQVDG